MEALRKRTNVFSEENDNNDNNVLSGGNNNNNNNDYGDGNGEMKVLSDKEYNQFGKTTNANVVNNKNNCKYNNSKWKGKCNLPKRDARGRFIKSKN